MITIKVWQQPISNAVGEKLKLQWSGCRSLGKTRRECIARAKYCAKLGDEAGLDAAIRRAAAFGVTIDRC
ncbi:MAG: hypothetical protein QJR02_07345 [Sinobacteraceae bacterium]|nr:hypothetical protein [Nevskiaceae bacterium]